MVEFVGDSLGMGRAIDVQRVRTIHYLSLKTKVDHRKGVEFINFFTLDVKNPLSSMSSKTRVMGFFTLRRGPLIFDVSR